LPTENAKGKSQRDSKGKIGKEKIGKEKDRNEKDRNEKDRNEKDRNEKEPARNQSRFQAEWRRMCGMFGVPEELVVSSSPVRGVWTHRML
jgi:hypothetical protein